MNSKSLLLHAFGAVALLFLVHSESIEEDSITFWVNPGSGLPQFNATLNESLSVGGCNPNGSFAIIVHGWLESWATEWVQDLVSNLTVYRGGCIIVMDYSNYSSNQNYFFLLPQFENISDVLLRFLQKLEGEKFNFEEKGYMFGFSFGAHLAITTATKFGAKRFKEIDVCDPAGPGFEHLSLGDASQAAQNVQCVHTSNNLGTMKRNCTQNWNMGVCGFVQVGAMPFPKGSHGLCPYFYTAAFEHEFVAWKNIYGCLSSRVSSEYPELFKMGYMETRKSKVTGDLYSPTSIGWPFNEIPGRIIKQKPRGGKMLDGQSTSGAKIATPTGTVTMSLITFHLLCIILAIRKS